MSLERIKEDFDFFKNEKYRQIKMRNESKQVFAICMTSLSIIFLGAIGSVFVKGISNPNKTPIANQLNIEHPAQKNIISVSTKPKIELSANTDKNKEQELQKITKELKDFEEKQMKNEPTKTINLIELKEQNKFIEDKDFNNVLNKDTRIKMSEYSEKIKNQKFTKEDMENMLELFDKLKKQDAAAFSKIKNQEYP